MSHFFRRPALELAALICIGVVLCGGGALLIGYHARNTLLLRDAERAAQSWGEHLVRTLEDLPALVEGVQPSEQTQEYLRTSKTVGDIFRYKFFGRNGAVRFISDDQRWEDFHQTTTGELSAIASRVIATGQSDLSARTGDGVSRPKIFASAYIPLRANNEIIGVIETYIDHSTKSGQIDQVLAGAGLAIALLTTLAFLIPMGGVAWQVNLRQKTASHLAHAARHDSLTGLLNRASFLDMIERSLERNERFALHFIDLDRFKDVNDTHGHPVGDALLIEITKRLNSVAGNEAVLARLGGDEFAMLQPLHDSNGFAADRLSRRSVHCLSVPVVIDAHEIRIGGSIGMALAPEHGNTTEKLLIAADLALYAAKRAGRGRSMVFDPNIEQERRARATLEQRLRDAVEQGGFELNYQPLYGTDGVSLRAFEALLRLKDEDGRPISPATFIPVAEELHLIDRIGVWVLEEACRTAAVWPESISVAVNLSPLQFKSGKLVEQVGSALAKAGLPPQRLELEVTESVLLDNAEGVLAQLKELKAKGISIALDDFGTGYSSLSYLWKFPFDTLKVDASFMEGLNDPTSRSREVLDTIIALGRVLDLHVTAEGVETTEQVDVLRELKCDYVQGFLFGRPIAGVDVAATILRSAVHKFPRTGTEAPTTLAAKMRA